MRKINPLKLNEHLFETIYRMEAIMISGLEVKIHVLHETDEIIRTATGLHKHSYYEFSQIFRGAMNYSWKSGSVTLSEKDFFFMPPDTFHNRKAFETPAVIMGFFLKIRPVNTAFSSFVADLPDLLKSKQYNFKGSEYLFQLSQTWRDADEWAKPLAFNMMDASIRNFILSFFQCHFGKQLDNIEKENSSSNKQHLPKLVDHYIEENIGRQIDISDIASFAGYSKRHLWRIFKLQTGKKLGNYIIGRKMKMARKILLYNNETIKAAAFQLGYKDLGYFCRLFKQQTGMTPTEYITNESSKAASG